MDRVLVFVPGIKGSFLRSGERRVWLEGRDLLRRSGASIALPVELEPDGVMDAIPLVPCWSVSVYGRFLEAVAERILVMPFAYDWRRDAREVSRELALKLEALAATKKRIVLVGHSLGGLISLHACRHGAARSVEKLVLAGSPFGGSPGFLRDICFGDSVGRNRSLLAKEAWLTWPSGFQLLPVPGAFFVDDEGGPSPADADDPREWTERGWSVFADPARRADGAALELLARGLEARRAFRRELEEGEARVPTLVIVGTGQPTIERVRLAPALDFEASPRAPGDGRVPAASARPRGQEHEVLETRFEHSKLLDDPAVLERLLRFAT